MVLVSDIIAFVEESVGHPLHRDEGVQHGTADTAVDTVAVCWMASREALGAAAGLGAQLVAGHESLYYPYDAVNRQDLPQGWQDWPTNLGRRRLLEEHGMTFARLHGSLDDLCIFDVFAERLGLGEPVEADGLAKVYEVEPQPLSALLSRAREATGMAHFRVAAPRGMDQVVSRVGLPWGGLGLFVNVGYQQRLLDLGCDVFIAGEGDSYGFRFAAECGVPTIETSHEDSENPGLQRFCELLAERFSGLRVEFIEVPRPWEWA
jgi:putative NIF3 family GTP cyclohydrolase 1 type 2